MTTRPPLKALLIDLSGTLHIGSTPTRDAELALKRLRNAGVRVRFCSNTSKESRGYLLKRLGGMGIDIEEDELFTSLSVVQDIVLSQSLRPMYLLTDSARLDFPLDKEGEEEHDSVVIGLAPDLFNYATLNEAFTLLIGEEQSKGKGKERKEKKRLIVTHKANYYRTSEGQLALGPGPFITALEEATGIQAEIVGKPSRAFFELTLRSLEKDGIYEADWNRVGMVGDDWRLDLPFVLMELGMEEIFLVKTGKFREGDGDEIDWITKAEDFAALVDELLDRFHVS